MVTEADIPKWAAIWAITAVFLIVRYWRNGAGVGLMFSYVLMFGVLHWIAPLMFLLPWHAMRGAEVTAEGLRQAAIATIALAAGSELFFWASRHTRLPHQYAAPDATIDDRLVNLYFLSGVILYLVVAPIASAVPTITAFVASGSSLLIVGMALHCWNAWARGARGRLWTWLLLSAAWPLITLVTAGFLGFGLGFTFVVLSFVASFYRPRWKVVVAALLIGYGGMSVYVTYMRDRAVIRSVVWNRGAFADRVGGVVDAFRQFEFFDPTNADHLSRVDVRLNQDSLIGAAVIYLSARPNSFARGQTFLDAVWALVPRAIWSSKPIVGGSGDLVATYTGLRFAEETSVGIGQVMEGYVNFGTDGVVALFVVLGFAIAMCDRWAYYRLSQGDGNGLIVWYLPGLCLLQVGGSLSEVTASAGAALGVAFVINRIAIFKRWTRTGVRDVVGLPVEDAPETVS